MTYTVIARKWRPVNFPDVIGQEHVTKTLENAILMDRVAHAYLFTGPRGVGKTSTARIFAKALNCENGPTTTPCNTCSSCVEIRESRSLDVMEIDGASNRGIDEIRNIRENVKYAPTRGKWKIYIIDEVHMLSMPAFNALLKTLEEPPSHVVFIFATTAAHKVPSTILSRCQRFDFKRIPISQIMDQLRKICDSEKVEITDDSLFLIAKKTDGSMRDGQSILDQAISFSGNKIDLKEVKDLLGIIEEEIFFEIAGVIAAKDLHGGYQLSEKILMKGYDPEEFMIGLLEFFRNLLIVKATDSVELLEVTEDEKSKFKEISKKFSEEDILKLLSITSDYGLQIKRSIHPMLMFEVALVKMIKLESSVNINDLLLKFANVPSAGGGSGNYANVQTAEAVKEKEKETGIKSKQNTYKSDAGESSPAGEINLQSIKEQWNNIVMKVKEKKISLGSFLSEGTPTGLENNVLEISFDSNNGFHIDVVNKNKDIIKETVRKVMGIDLTVSAVKSHQETESKNGIKKDAERSLKEAVDDIVKRNPVVKHLMDMFEGEVVRLKK